MLFRSDPTRPPPETDAVALLRRINLYRAGGGKPPATPDWFLKGVPRGGR